MARILLIEDDDAIRQLLMENLARDGHAVTTAANGREGLERYRPGAFDLIVTDLIMPEKEGLEMLQELKVRDPNLRALAMSAGGHFRAPENYLRLATLLGAANIIAKPFTRDRFLEAVRKALEGEPQG